MKNVLVADDDADVRALLSSALGSFVSVTAVGDAEEALALLEGGPMFDMVISDYMLPGISGLEFVKRIRALPSQLPILIITGNTRDSVRSRALAAGADAFLDKPFTVQQLRATIRTLLARPA